MPVLSHHHPTWVSLCEKTKTQKQKTSDSHVNLSVQYPKQFLKTFQEVRVAAGFWLAARAAPNYQSTPAGTGIAPGVARGPWETYHKCSSLARVATGLALSRPKATKAWDEARAQPPGSSPSLFCPRFGTAGASWGPRRHAVEEARRCRRHSRRSPAAAAAAASLFPSRPELGGQSSRAAGSGLRSSRWRPGHSFSPCPPRNLFGGEPYS